MHLSTFSANKLLIFIFNLLFSKRTWKILFILISLGSMYTSYHFVQKVYNFHCKEGGYFILKTTCEQLRKSEFNESENDRLTRENERLIEEKYQLTMQ